MKILQLHSPRWHATIAGSESIHILQLPFIAYIKLHSAMLQRPTTKLDN